MSKAMFCVVAKWRFADPFSVLRNGRASGPLVQPKAAYLIRCQRVPEYAIWNHPAVRQEHIRSELHGYQLVVYLNNYTFDPPADTLTILLMVAEHFDGIPHVKTAVSTGCPHVVVLWDATNPHNGSATGMR